MARWRCMTPTVREMLVHLYRPAVRGQQSRHSHANCTTERECWLWSFCHWHAQLSRLHLGCDIIPFQTTTSEKKNKRKHSIIIIVSADSMMVQLTLFFFFLHFCCMYLLTTVNSIIPFSMWGRGWVIFSRCGSLVPIGVSDPVGHLFLGRNDWGSFIPRNIWPGGH